jgi:hypothetical protein
MAIRSLQLPGAFGRKGKLFRIVAVVAGAALAGTAAYAVTNWVVGLGSGSNALGKAATVTNITVTAVATPAPSNLLYPGGTGDVVLKITNPNHFPVTITTLKVPSTSTFAIGYSTSGLTTTVTTCGASATGSDVVWHYSTSSTSTTHTLTTPLTVGPSGNANDPLTVTLSGGANMGTGASTKCEGKYFKMASLKGVTAYGGGSASITSSPATDS